MEIIEQILNLGDAGVGIAQIITALNPASWWASGVLTIIKAGIEAVLSLFAA